MASLVQAYGRGMRNEADYCNTYILDQDIYGVLMEKWRKCLYFIPEYFEEAILCKILKTDTLQLTLGLIKVHSPYYSKNVL